MNWKTEYKKSLADPEYFRVNYFLGVYPEETRTLKERADTFANEAMFYSDKENMPFTNLDMIAFIEYWTATGKLGDKMRFEKQDMFHFPGRLRTWLAQKKRFNTIKLTRKMFNGSNFS